ncbi:MAG: ketoacyl-ACP synthase III [Acidobacteriota bacterium]|nr:ketoacyl-ACP synthase III [Acidobacteriota bacterium]
MHRTVVVGTGSHIPSVMVPNDYFLQHEFHGPDNKPIAKSNAEILEQFEAITGIRERRYVPDELVTSDIAFDAARNALQSSGIDGESLDYIIVAHNFGDVKAGSLRSDFVPALAARVKNKLEIENPRTVAVDVVFGCPGWLQGVIWADSMIRAGDIKRAMVIGADTLSRISDPHDRDSLIYADGAGATILEARETKDGILSHNVRSDTLEHSTMLRMGHSYKDESFLEALFLKMEGRKLYKYALQTVAGSIKECLDCAQIGIHQVKKILIHQANGKMDEAILDALYALYGIKEPPGDVMPMTISTLGNSSVATIPTMLDLICKGKMRGHALHTGDIVVFASVGAGMHINAVVYRVPK